MPVSIKLNLYFVTIFFKLVSVAISAIPYMAIIPKSRVGITIIILGALNLL